MKRERCIRISNGDKQVDGAVHQYPNLRASSTVFCTAADVLDIYYTVARKKTPCGVTCHIHTGSRDCIRISGWTRTYQYQRRPVKGQPIANAVANAISTFQGSGRPLSLD